MSRTDFELRLRKQRKVARFEIFPTVKIFSTFLKLCVFNLFIRDVYSEIIAFLSQLIKHRKAFYPSQ